MDALETYVKQMHDPELYRWWGHYCESIVNVPGAIEAFQSAKDALSLVRLHCRNEDFVAASNLVEESGDAAAAFLLARQLEATEQVLPGDQRIGTMAKQVFVALMTRFSHTKL